jgi:hypothetical protein
MQFQMKYDLFPASPIVETRLHSNRRCSSGCFGIHITRYSFRTPFVCIGMHVCSVQ